MGEKGICHLPTVKLFGYRVFIQRHKNNAVKCKIMVCF